jgi:pimeloyl-ACP methyl ester carboxylesterase
MCVAASSAPSIPGTTEHWANIGGNKIHYLRAGSGPPLLMIHGLLGYSFSWRFNFAGLGRVRQVIAPDLLGTGFSAHPSDLDCSVEACVQRMLQLMTELGADKFDLVGTSHGGGVAALMCAIAPKRVRKLVLVAPVNPWSRHGRWITRVLATPVGRLGMKTIAPHTAFMNSYWLARMYGDPQRIVPGTLEGYQAPLRIGGIWEYGLGVVKCWHNDLARLESAYEHIQNQTLLLWGDRDPAVFPSSAQELLKRIPHAKLEIFAGVGHLPYEEVPDEFNRVLCDFLNSQKK